MDKIAFKSSLRQGLLAGAAVIGLMAVAPDANASSYALSQLTVDNLILTSPGGTLPTFNSFSFVSRTSASLFGVGAPTSTSNANTVFSFGTDIASCNAAAATGGCVDPAVRFLTNTGAVNPGENAFAPLGKGGNFAYSDAILTDTKINSTSGTPGGGGHFKHVAEGSVNGGNSTGQAGETAQAWTFSVNLTSGQTLTIDFDAILAMIADTSDPNALNARSVSDMFISLQDDSGVETDSIVQTLHRTLTDTTQGLLKTASFSGHLSASVVAAHAGSFLFSVISTNSVDVNAAAPEPATLSLMGLGLLGLGYASRRRRKQS